MYRMSGNQVGRPERLREDKTGENVGELKQTFVSHGWQPEVECFPFDAF